MIGDEELDTILTTLGGQLDDAELDRWVAGFRDALRRLREDTAEAARIDALTADPRDDQSVAALVTRAVAGDPVAWDEIVERYAPLVWSICARFQLSNHDRDDVGQNVWLLLIEHLGRLREPAALPGWLATTTRRECLRVVTAARKSERAGTTLDQALQLADHAAIDQEILLTERNIALTAALDGLPARCQQLLAMLMADPPYSYAEISAALHIPIGSIGPQRARCLQRLRRSDTFTARGPGDEPSAASGEARQGAGGRDDELSDPQGDFGPSSASVQQVPCRDGLTSDRDDRDKVPSQGPRLAAEPRRSGLGLLPVRSCLRAWSYDRRAHEPGHRSARCPFFTERAVARGPGNLTS